MLDVFGEAPYGVIAEFHRKHIDANRPDRLQNCAYEVPRRPAILRRIPRTVWTRSRSRSPGPCAMIHMQTSVRPLLKPWRWASRQGPSWDSPVPSGAKFPCARCGVARRGPSSIPGPGTHGPAPKSRPTSKIPPGLPRQWPSRLPCSSISLTTTPSRRLWKSLDSSPTTGYRDIDGRWGKSSRRGSMASSS